VSAAATATPVAILRPLPAEEAARGDFYALLARLLNAAPDAALLAQLAAAGPIPAEGDPGLARSWQGLVDASSAMDADAAAEEHELLFAGIGKSEVSVFAGYYSAAASIDHPRVRILADLAALGLGQRAQVTEPEDHYAGLFEVMRILVAGGAGRSPASVAEQRRFYEAHIKPGVARFFAALAAAKHANLYRHVAAVGGAFTALETESFQLD
jgi:TorA maturation chaperone TorD